MRRRLETFGGETTELGNEQSLAEVQRDLFVIENLEELKGKIEGNSEMKKRAELYANRE